MKKITNDILKNIQSDRTLPIVFQNLETKLAVEKLENVANPNQSIYRNQKSYKKYEFYRPISKITIYEK